MYIGRFVEHVTACHGARAKSHALYPTSSPTVTNMTDMISSRFFDVSPTQSLQTCNLRRARDASRVSIHEGRAAPETMQSTRKRHEKSSSP